MFAILRAEVDPDRPIAVLFVPAHRSSETIRNGRLRRPTEQAPGLCNVRPRGQRIRWMGGTAVNPRNPAELPFQEGDDLQDGHGTIAAQIDDLITERS